MFTPSSVASVFSTFDTFSLADVESIFCVLFKFYIAYALHNDVVY